MTIQDQRPSQRNTKPLHLLETILDPDQCLLDLDLSLDLDIALDLDQEQKLRRVVSILNHDIMTHTT